MARRHTPGQLGLFLPETDWRMPTELPDLRGRKIVAIDSETRDLGLASKRGPGWALGPHGYICGVSWAAEGSVGYAPTAHPDSECFPLDNVMRWLDDLFRSGTRIVLHNGPYDIGWFGAHGVAPPVSMEDTLAACVMIDETTKGFDLDSCCERNGVPGKDKRMLADAVEAFGGDRSRPVADLWRVPARYAGVYAEADTLATLALWGQVEGQLRAQDVWDAYRTEIDLIPMVVAMRRRGIRIDTEAAMRTADEFRALSRQALERVGEVMSLRRPATLEEARSPQVLERWFRSEKIPFPKTESGKQGSFAAEWMEKYNHPLPQAIVAVRKYEEAASKFVENFLLGYSHRGRVHSEVHQFLSEEGGTRSHRFSYSDPALQQMPSPDKDPREDDPDLPPGNKKGALIYDRAVGTKIRGLFLPEEEEFWVANDYSQQEPRITVHFAAACRIPGVEEALERYRNNPRTDYHTMVSEMTGLVRPRAKILNLALTYGKGLAATAEELGVSLDEAKQIMDLYFDRLPFIKPLEEMSRRLASQRGYIRLIDGARVHYNNWEGGYMDKEARAEAKRNGHRLDACLIDVARERQKIPGHPWATQRLRRADTRKGLNNLVQGSAARQTKKAMLEMWRQGILPLIQMHDELGASCATQQQAIQVAEIMRTAVPLLVPVIVDTEVGTNWGNAKMTWERAEEYRRAA